MKLKEKEKNYIIILMFELCVQTYIGEGFELQHFLVELNMKLSLDFVSSHDKNTSHIIYFYQSHNILPLSYRHVLE